MAEKKSKKQKPEPEPHPGKEMSSKEYYSELEKLEIELVKLQEWVKFNGLKVVVLFEGRDAAGKGGAIKRITESLNPRFAASLRWAHPPKKRRPSGIFNATCSTSRPPVRWYSSTAAGTTAPVWNA